MVAAGHVVCTEAEADGTCIAGYQLCATQTAGAGIFEGKHVVCAEPNGAGNCPDEWGKCPDMGLEDLVATSGSCVAQTCGINDCLLMPGSPTDCGSPGPDSYCPVQQGAVCLTMVPRIYDFEQ